MCVLILNCIYVCSCWINLDVNVLFRESKGLKPMDSEQLRENAHKMVDFIADYYKSIENFPVLSQVEVFNLP